MTKITGAEIVIDTLKNHGVKDVFLYPGGTFAPILDVIYRKKSLNMIVVRHEQGAAHAADGYARITGTAGVCMATSGPGATNLITGIANAYLDSIPMVAFTGQVGTSDLKKDHPTRQMGFQEADIVNMVKPITKHAITVLSVQDLPGIINDAFQTAISGRPGPVLVDVPMNVQFDSIDYAEYIRLCADKPLNKTNMPVDRKIICSIRDKILSAKKPVIYAGGGVILSEAWDEIKQLAETLQIPVATTLMGIGCFPATSPLSLGMMGHVGNRTCNLALSESDFILVAGARLDVRATGTQTMKFGENKTIVHIDIDPNEINKRIKSDVHIIGDVKKVLNELLKSIDIKHVKSHDMWLNKIEGWKKKYPLVYTPSNTIIKPQYVIEQLSELTHNNNTIITTDVGQNQLWTANYYKFTKPKTHITSGGLGCMGFSLPAAIGAQLANPDALVVSINGDGGFQMNLQELATVAKYDLPIIIILLNNNCLGFVRQFQEIAFEKRYTATLIDFNPDFMKIAEAYGISGIRVKEHAEVRRTLEKVIVSGKATLIEFVIDPAENVFPILLAGKTLDDMYPPRIEVE